MTVDFQLIYQENHIAFCLCLMMGTVLGYLGTHVLRRGVVFIDISLAQFATIGGILAEHVFCKHGHSHSHEREPLAYFCSVIAVILIAVFYSVVRKYKKNISLEAIIGVTYAIGFATAVFIISVCGSQELHAERVAGDLNAIMGFSTLLNTKEVSKEDQKEYLRILANSGKLLLEIIDNIIDISKVESSTLTVSKSNSNLNTLLDELLIDFLEYKNNMKLDKIDITLQKEINDKELYILTDLKRLKQVYSNLLDNALKFTEKGKVEFGYYIKGQEIICFVKDTGIGINEDEVNFIFDRFRQADESTTRKYGGTGIGLALCKSLIELLGGKLWVESKKGDLPANKAKGAKFYFTIPYDVVKPNKKLFEKPKIVENVDWSNKKILIAEDVETNYKLLFSFLSKTKVKIYWAKDGREAIDMVEKNPDFDLILMDINMPIMTGHEALKHLIKKGYNMPVIAQTAYATEDQRYEIIDLGYSDYILKPITFQSLLQKLSKFLD